MRAPGHRRRRSDAQSGFTYAALMILVAILALVSSATLSFGHLMQRREAEERLLEVGHAYRQAIASYRNSSYAGGRAYPASLADLLRDPRFPGVRRHLRQLYADPITGRNEWGLLLAAEGGIMGVHSLSRLPPIKVAGFSEEDASFEKATTYAEWVFAVLPATPGRAPGTGTALGQGGGTLPGQAAAPGVPSPLPSPAARAVPSTGTSSFAGRASLSR